MSKRDIDTGRVIDEVRIRKCLWDVTDLLYKNKDARNKAWEDIVVALFENVSEEEKDPLGKLVQQRWKTARDAFFRTKATMKNTPSGSSAKKYKKYIFYDELSFLNRSDLNEVDESMNEMNSILSPSVNTASLESTANTGDPLSSINTQPAPSNTQQEEQEIRSTNSASSQRPWNQKRKNRPRPTNQDNSQFERELLSLLSNQTPDIASDDLAFFSSLGPILRNFDIEQKLEFRSTVLRAAMEIRNMHRPSSSASTVASQDMRSPPQYEPHPQATYEYYETQTVGYPGYETASSSTAYTTNNNDE